MTEAYAHQEGPIDLVKLLPRAGCGVRLDPYGEATQEQTARCRAAG